MNKFKLLNFLFNKVKKGDPLEKMLSGFAGNRMKGPSREKKKGIAVVETPKEGGVFTYFNGAKYPFPGFPDREAVKGLAMIKRLIPMGIDLMHDGLQHLKPENPKQYCRAAREIYRVFNIIISREGKIQEGMRIKWTKIRDIACLAMEYDDAYRFRFQDISQEIDLKELELTEEDKYWFRLKDYNFKGKEEIIKRYGKENKG